MASLNSLLRRLAHEALLARLWLEARLGASSTPRVMATACWSFPIYSQTFVHQEVMALAEGGFSVRFLYAQRGPRSALAHACAGLWSRKRRVLLHVETGAVDLARFRKSHPAVVDSLLADIAQASGMTPAQVERHEHFLHAFSFARAVQAWGADYLHSYFFYEQSLFALVAARLLGIPRGISCYADHMLADYPLKVVKLQLQDCNVLVATSRRIAGELESIHGASLSCLLVKPNAIDTASFTPVLPSTRTRDQAVRVLCVCRIDPKKGIEYLIDAARRVLDSGLRVEVRIIGAPDAHSDTAQAYARALEAQVDRIGVGQTVHFVGQRSNREIRAELARADLFVAPYVDLPNGDKDGIPTAVLEAMAAGCAIIATDAGSLAEIIDDDVHGVRVPQRSSQALADAVHRLARDSALADRLGASALARVRAEYDIGTSEVLLHQRVREVVAARRSAPKLRAAHR